MARRRFTPQQKVEAVALAAVVGSDAAGEQLGIDPRTIRSWAELAGKGPELAVDPASWKTLLDLALARVASAIASGTMRPRDVAIVAGIAQRNYREPEREAPEEKEDDAANLFGLRHVVFRRVVRRHELDPMAFLRGLAGLYADDLGIMGDAVCALQAFHTAHGCHSDDWNQYPDPCPESVDPIEWLETIGDPAQWLKALRASQDAETQRALEGHRAAREAEPRP